MKCELWKATYILHQLERLPIKIQSIFFVLEKSVCGTFCSIKVSLPAAHFLYKNTTLIRKAHADAWKTRVCSSLSATCSSWPKPLRGSFSIDIIQIDLAWPWRWRANQRVSLRCVYVWGVISTVTRHSIESSATKKIAKTPEMLWPTRYWCHVIRISLRGGFGKRFIYWIMARGLKSYWKQKYGGCAQFFPILLLGILPPPPSPPHPCFSPLFSRFAKPLQKWSK